MKTLIKILFVPVLFFALYSCSSNDSETIPDSNNKNKSIQNQTEYTTYSEESSEPKDFYLVNTDTRVGEFRNSKFIIAKDITGKYLKNDEGVRIRIDSVETMNTKILHLKYLSIHGSSNEKGDNGKDFSRYYHIAFPIYDEPDYSARGGGCPSQTNTCSSANPPDNCNHCAFDKDSNGCITGCKCNDFFGGTCLHSVTSSSIATPLSLSLVAAF